MNRKYLSGPYLIWTIGFIILPLIAITVYGLSDAEGHFTLSNVLAIFNSINGKALLFSLAIAFGCTIICILVSYPAALILRSFGTSNKSFMLFILLLPMWMNFVLRILAWQMILSKNGILNLLLSFIGLGPVAIANTWQAMMIGMVYDFLPYMMLPVYNAVCDISEDTIEAAKDLGAGKFSTFWHIILPLSSPGVFSGIIMVFVPAMTSFAIADILGGGKLLLMGNIIEQEFTKSMDWHLGSGLSLSLMLLLIIGMLFTVKKDNKSESTKIW